MSKEHLKELISSKMNQYIELSHFIWENPELRFQTDKAAERFAYMLDKEGFKVETNVAGVPNAIKATFGNKGPVIGLLAEYDALSNMNQIADLGHKESEKENQPGHGCGHNLLGVASLAATVALKDYLIETRTGGTIILFGCPAEESGYGKAYLAKAGVFKGVDAMLAWHPSDITSPWYQGTLAVVQSYFSFEGVAAHAATNPELGRSALDAAELMNVGVNYLREHIPEGVRLHYAYIDAGGESANVVQASSKLHYFIRATEPKVAMDVFERVKKIAQGAALMTETKLSVDFDSACMNYVPNKRLTDLIFENLKQYGDAEYDKFDLAYASRYRMTLTTSQVEKMKKKLTSEFGTETASWVEKQSKLSLCSKVATTPASNTMMVSTDVGDVSWVVPTGQFNYGCEPLGTAPHSWQWVANGKSEIAHKGIEKAGQILAFSALDLIHQPDVLEEVKDEFAQFKESRPFQSMLLDNAKPH